MTRSAPMSVVALATLCLTGCGDTAGPAEPAGDPPVAMAKGGNGGGGGGGQNTTTSELAVFTITDTDNLMHDGSPVYESGGCVSAFVYDSTGANLLMKDEKRGMGNKLIAECDRRVTAVLAHPHNPGHEGEKVIDEETGQEVWNPQLLNDVHTLHINQVNVRIRDYPDDPYVLGRSLMNGPDVCPDWGVRLDPNSGLPESTAFDVQETAPGFFEVSTLPYPDNIAGCLIDGQATYWHVDMRFTVEEVGGS